MTAQPKVSFAKGASLYYKHWAQLKAHPNTVIVYQLDVLYHKKFKKALIKRKWLDVQFKATYPRAKISFKATTSTLEIRLLTTGTIPLA